MFDEKEFAYHHWDLRGRPAESALDDWLWAARVAYQLKEQKAYYHWINRGQPLWDAPRDWYAVTNGETDNDESGDEFVREHVREETTREMAYFRSIDPDQTSDGPEQDWSAAKAELASAGRKAE